MSARDEIEARLGEYLATMDQVYANRGTTEQAELVIFAFRRSAPTDLRHLLDALAAAEAEVQRLREMLGQTTDTLGQALGQWRMYAEMRPDSEELEKASHPEGHLYRRGLEVHRNARAALAQATTP